MSLPVLILLEGLAYAVIFGGLALLRREGLSGRFAVETVVITLAASGVTALTNFPFHPVVFLIILYLLTLRVRLLVDLGTIFARRERWALAEKSYNVSLRLWPDSSSRLIALVNLGTLRLQQGALEAAVTTFKDVLQQAGQGYLGIKYEAAAHYNLAVAYQKLEKTAPAIAELNAVLEVWPASEFGRRAERALEHIRHKDKPTSAERDTSGE